MKKISLSIGTLLISMLCFGQLNTNLVVSATPPGTLIDWATKKETLTYVIVNSGLPRQVVIKTEIKTFDGTVVANTNLAKARIINVERGNNLILSAAEVLPIEVMIFYGKFKTTLEKTGKLLADNYQLCVQLVTPVDFLPVSEQRCRNFTIAAFQLPIPVMPANETILELDKAKTTITFRWTPVAPRPTTPVTYRILVFEILQNQTPMQALRSNQPVLVKDIVGTTQYIWQHQLALMPCCRGGDLDGDGADKAIATDSTSIINGVNAYGFTWTLQTFDQLGRPFGDGNINGDAISEPSVFFIDRRLAEVRKAGQPKKIIYLDKEKRN